MPSSVVLLAGLAMLAGGAGLLVAVRRERRRLGEVRHLLVRVSAAADEVEHVDWARRRLGDGFNLAWDGATGVNDVVRRSGQAIAGIPFAILDTIGRNLRRDDDAD
ncbi:MAG TPA: hypothetical protein VKB55_03035 [Nocardioidaceae bacterium]|nr:hypothetical protein [Nocardioidaceae bacterium]